MDAMPYCSEANANTDVGNVHSTCAHSSAATTIKQVKDNMTEAKANPEDGALHIDQGMELRPISLLRFWISEGFTQA